MEVLRHDYVSVNHKTVLLARLFQDGKEKVAAFGRGQLGLAVVAAAGYEMQVVIAVVAMQALGHPAIVDSEFLVWL
jgi:hypothetical protein